MTELKERWHRVRVAAARLQDRHYHWIVDAALRHFQKRVAEEEQAIIRHERFRDEEPEGYLSLVKPREQEIAELRASVAEHRAIIAFLRAVHDALALASAEQFAADLRASGFFRPLSRKC
jgi:hypothetical protein